MAVGAGRADLSRWRSWERSWKNTAVRRGFAAAVATLVQRPGPWLLFYLEIDVCWPAPTVAACVGLVLGRTQLGLCASRW